jgi:hypothetical protein
MARLLVKMVRDVYRMLLYSERQYMPWVGGVKRWGAGRELEETERRQGGGANGVKIVKVRMGEGCGMGGLARLRGAGAVVFFVPGGVVAALLNPRLMAVIPSG